MANSKIHSGHIEVAVANLLDYTVYTIVPNVSHGLSFNHECDLLCLDKKNRFTEVEIKISIADLKADFKKKHGHKSKYIGRLIYAFPEEMLEKALPLIPEKFGVIIVKTIQPKTPTGHVYYKAFWFRQCKHDKDAVEVPAPMIRGFMRLGCMRIWSLKKHNNG